MAEGFTDVYGSWVSTFEGFRIDELESTLDRYNKTDPGLFAEWLDPRYNNDAPVLQRKLAAARRYQNFAMDGGEEGVQKRLKKTQELEMGIPTRPSAATTLMTAQKAPTDSLLTKTLLGA